MECDLQYVDRAHIMKTFNERERRTGLRYLEVQRLKEAGLKPKDIVKRLRVTATRRSQIYCYYKSKKIPFPIRAIMKLEELGLLPFKVKRGDPKGELILEIGLFTLGDGHICTSDKRVYLCGHYSDMLELKERIWSVLEITPRYFLYTKRGFKHLAYVVLPPYIGRLLLCLGFPEGNKTNNAFRLPIFVKRKKWISKLFLGIFLGNEGGKATVRNKRFYISVRLRKNEEILDNGKKFMYDTINICRKFGLKTSKLRTKRIGKSFELSFNVLGMKSLLVFYSKIGFKYAQNKQHALEECARRFVKELEEKCLFAQKYFKAQTMLKDGCRPVIIAKQLHVTKETIYNWRKRAPNYIYTIKDLEPLIKQVRQQASLFS